MGHYLLQGNYASSSVKAMVDNPHDRTEKVEKLIRSAGGQLHHFYFAMGESDWIIVCELPTDVAAAAVSLAVAASGAVTNGKTTKLMTATEAVSALTQAKSLDYSAPAKS